MFPSANQNFTRGKSPLVRAVNGLSDPKTGPDSLTAFRYGGCHVSVTLDESTSMIYRHGSGHFRDDYFGNVMEHFYDSLDFGPFLFLFDLLVFALFFFLVWFCDLATWEIILIPPPKWLIILKTLPRSCHFTT